jgi:predicted AAA+ superfamily ATPase
MIERTAVRDLEKWFDSKNRNPLIVRGARQVGKTWLIRHFAAIKKKKLIELNFEKNPAHKSLFSSNHPKEILLNLETIFNEKINNHSSLLFLDEIQAAPEMLAKLRWFAEEMPGLPLIAAGSLLEFTLADHQFSMPVGRVNYMHLEPLSFEEFLLANQKELLCDYIKSYHLKVEIPESIHEQLLLLFKEYVIVGGLPAVTSSWITSRSLSEVNQIQHDLWNTYRDDFAKYKGKLNTEKLDEVLKSIPTMLGQKFVFNRVDSSLQSKAIKQILSLFDKARICHHIWSCSANGVPLGAQIKEKYFKEIFLDTGLCCAALGINYTAVSSIKDIILINSGGIAEQVVGQLLRTIEPYYIEPALYCWHREEGQSNAEIDYIIQHGNNVIPIEVKAGSTGSLKSLHLFMGLKKTKIAIRINSDFPTLTQVKTKNPLDGSNVVEYNLFSLPFYLIGQIQRLLRA